jgi:hypothetical protein
MSGTDPSAPAIAAFAGELRVDQTSRALWEEYTAEFIASASAEKAEYVARVNAICAAAHTRLDEELQAAGARTLRRMRRRRVAAWATRFRSCAPASRRTSSKRDLTICTG